MSALPSHVKGIETDMIRMSGKKLILTLFYLYGGWALITLAFLALPALAAGIFIDLRWLIVFLMLLFLVTPMLMVFLYFYHGLRQSTASNIVEHKLLFTQTGITFRLFEKVEEEEYTEEESKEKWHVRSEKLYPYDQVANYKTSSDGVLLMLTAPEKGFIWLPYTAFSHPSLFQEAIACLKK